jgi:predicted GNAT family acetyltransferase
MFHVEKMKTTDFPFAIQLANTMNWNMTSEDFEFMMKLEPQGCFTQFHANERVGIATTISFGKVGWFGNFIVKEDVRRKGAGSLLITKAIDYLQNKGVETIGLYAYPHLVKFYERFGFKPDIDFSVLKGKAMFPSTKAELKEATKRDIPELIDLDCTCFGANRKKLLSSIILKNGNLCYVSTESNGIIGYIAAKVYGKMAEVGPLVCPSKNVKAALQLIKTILTRINDHEVFIYIPSNEEEILNMLYQAGLEKDFSLVRMFLGPAITRKCIYAAESLERG